MAKLEDMPENEQRALLNMSMPTYKTRPWVTGPALKDRRIAAVTTAGLHQRDDKPFSVGTSEYRIIPNNVKARELVMSHISVNFDRSGYQQDLNIAFPIDRLHELAAKGKIGSLGSYHYSFMGATDPSELEPNARRLASILKSDGVDSVLLTGV